MQKEADAMVVIAQDVVRAAANDDAVAFACQVLNNLGLCIEDDVFWCIVSVGVNVHLVKQVMNEVAAHAFFVFLDVVF